MGQTSYSNRMPAGFPGMAFDDTGHVLTALNKSPEVQQITTVTVGTGGAQTMTLRINGFDSTAVGEGGDTTTDNATDLAAAVNANRFISGAVVAEASGADVVITSRVGGKAFTITAEAGDLSLAATQANAQADPIPFGRATVRTGSGSNDEATILCGLASAARLAAQVDTLTLTYDAAVDALVTIEYYDPALGEYVERSFAHNQATDADTSVAALATQINAVLPANTILASSATNVLTLTSEVAGQPFNVSYGFGTGRDTGAWAHTTNRSASTDVNLALLGVLQYTATQESTDDSNGDSSIPGNSLCNVRAEGRIDVESEDSSVIGKPVYVRLVANGSLNKLGGFRATPNAGCVKLKGWSWFKEFGSNASGGRNLCVVQQF